MKIVILLAKLVKISQLSVQLVSTKKNYKTQNVNQVVMTNIISILKINVKAVTFLVSTVKDLLKTTVLNVKFHLP